MDCPRCGEPLESYRLDDSETVVCGNCTYLGVSVDHKREGRRRESWDDALNRFHEQQQSVTKVTEITDSDVLSELREEDTDDDSKVLPVIEDSESKQPAPADAGD